MALWASALLMPVPLGTAKKKRKMIVDGKGLFRI